MRNLTVRDLQIDDVNVVRDIHDDTFPFPDLSKLLYMNKKVVEDDSKIIAAGFCRLTSEGILVIDERVPKTLRTRAIISLIQEMTKETSAMGMDECHVFVQSQEIQAFLEKLGFVHCSGIPMVVTYG
jgi:N-acetylglutamate synthase-like GNAT family acetyltransferase